MLPSVVKHFVNADDGASRPCRAGQIHGCTLIVALQEMSYIWSPEKKFSTWRRLWVALAKAEKELGAYIPVLCFFFSL